MRDCDKNSYVVTMNKQGQLCYTTGEPYKLLRIELRKRNENYFVSPRGDITVLRVMLKSGETDFSPIDMNNNGWIVGVVHYNGGARIIVLIPKNSLKPK
jgi:hypothetical protein